MASVKRFQDLECHKLAVLMRREVIRLTARDPVRRDFEYVTQIRDAARGGPRNIAEGFSRFNPTEILQFLSYAQAPIDETKNHTIDAHESSSLTDEECDRVLTLIRRTLGAIRNCSPTGMLDLEIDQENNLWLSMMYQGGIARFDKKAGTFKTWTVPPEFTVHVYTANVGRQF
jgi:four helix bundle protein